MATKDQILTFFRDPLKFAGDIDASQAKTWLRALTEVAEPRINEKQDRPLRSAQIKAWRAIAQTRVALVLGPPGTGKTFALSSMAAAYLEARRATTMPCRILVTGFTLNSIANLLDAIAERLQMFVETTAIPPIYFFGTDS